MIQTIEYNYAGPSPYEDWINRGSPHDVCISYCEQWPDKERPNNTNKEYYLLMPHLDLIYAYGYVWLDWQLVSIETVFKFKVDIGNRMVTLTGAVCKTPEFVTAWGGHFKKMTKSKDNKLLHSIRDYLFGHRWNLQYGRPSFVQKSMMKIVQSYNSQCHASGAEHWEKIIGHYGMSRTISAIKIQASFRGWQVRMKYRYSPYNNLGRHVIMKMMNAD